jgi:hypothetical protein
MGWKNQNFPQLWIAYQAQIDSSDLPGLANEVDSVFCCEMTHGVIQICGTLWFSQDGVSLQANDRDSQL